MPVVPKSYLPAFAGFLGMSPYPYHPLNLHRTNRVYTVFGLTYTTYVASKEGAAVDGARTRWQNQHARARTAMSGGMTLAEWEAKQ